MIVFGPDQLIKSFSKWSLERAIKNKDPSLETNQRDANLLYEKDDFDISLKYTVICKTLSLTMFYLPMMPIVVLYGFLTMVLGFFMTKFILYKRSNGKTKYSCQISKNMTDEFELCLFLFPCGLLVTEFVLSFEAVEQFNPSTVTIL